MAKAHLTTNDGTKVTIEGSEEEIARLLGRLQGDVGNEASSQPKQRGRAKARSSPVGAITELIEASFFKKPKSLSAIKDELEQRGHFYPVTTLSPTVLRFVRKKELRRLKENNRWVYVG